MSRKIAIVGAGQSGLPLALALQARGDQITLISNRSPDDLRKGKILSSQCMFDAALQIERDFGLNSGSISARPCKASATPCRIRKSAVKS